MVQPGENIWTLRFQLLLGLTLAGEIILGIIVYRIFAYSTARTEFALAAFLLACGILVLSTLQQPVARKVILGAGSFILLALLVLLLVIPNSTKGASAAQPGNTLRQFLALVALVLTLIAFFGKIVTERAARTANMIYAPNNWFAGLAHLALAALAGVELFLQLASGNQIRLLPFTTQIYAGLSLNTVALLLLGAIVAFSLLSLRSALTWLDGVMLLILGAVCALFQYTFGAIELAQLHLGLNSGLTSNINFALSLVPLVLAVLAVFVEGVRFFTPLWLAVQLLILQPYVGTTRAVAGRIGLVQTPQLGQIILYVLAIALVLLTLRLLLYWDRRELNGIDGITIACVALAVGLTAWSLGQSYLLVSLLILCAVLALILIGIHTFFNSSIVWLGRAESVIAILFTLGITLIALLLFNTPGSQGSYITASTLNPHGLNPALPRIFIRNQFVLDGLFVLFSLIYVLALIRQRWNRRFAHTERALLILSGFSCLLILAGDTAVLSLVVANVQRVGLYIQTAFSGEGLAATGILIAALISLLWLFRGRNRADRIVLAVLPGLAILCICIYYLSASSFFFLCSLPLLTAETLIATRVERTQTEHQEVEAENGTYSQSM